MSASAHPVHTLADLENWPANPPSLAVIGQPVTHSLSPAMHNAALAALASHAPRFATWRYHKFEIAPAELPQALRRFHEHGFLGVNVTVPHKEALLDHVESADAFARAAGAANTLVRTPAGWRAFNTDGSGLAAALQADFGVPLAGAHVVLLGAGGAARGAAVRCLRDGVASLSIGNRGQERLRTLLDHLAPFAGAIPLRGFALDAPPADLPPGALVINSTTVGLKGSEGAPVDLTKLPAPARVYDMIYNPPQTPLLAQAAALGLPHANGLSMLVHQGAHALTLWTQLEAPVEIMDRAARAAFAA
jgi:shikimate dehydrogenase